MLKENLEAITNVNVIRVKKKISDIPQDTQNVTEIDLDSLLKEHLGLSPVFVTEDEIVVETEHLLYIRMLEELIEKSNKVLSGMKGFHPLVISCL